MATYSSIAHNFTPPSATTSTQVGAGAMTLLKTVTADDSSDVNFKDGSNDVVMDSTYKTYIFEYIEAHPVTDNVEFRFQGNASGASGFNETMTTTIFRAQNDEGGTDTNLLYNPAGDQANGTGFQMITQTNAGNANDESSSGEMFLFNPSSTTFVKHFISRLNTTWSGNGTFEKYAAGYINNTAAVTRIQFKMNAGTIDSGLIKLYGIKDS